jgi:hypothetical protein
MIFLKLPYCGVLKMVKSNISQCNVIMATSEDIDQTRAKCVAKQHGNKNEKRAKKEWLAIYVSAVPNVTKKCDKCVHDGIRTVLLTIP